MVVLFNIAGVVYLRRNSVVVLYLGFSMVALVFHLPILDNHLIADLVRRLAESDFPTPRQFDLRDFIDYAENITYKHQIKEQSSKYVYALENSGVICMLLTVQALFLSQSTVRVSARSPVADRMETGDGQLDGKAIGKANSDWAKRHNSGSSLDIRQKSESD